MTIKESLNKKIEELAEKLDKNMQETIELAIDAYSPKEAEPDA